MAPSAETNVDDPQATELLSQSSQQMDQQSPYHENQSLSISDADNDLASVHHHSHPFAPDFPAAPPQTAGSSASGSSSGNHSVSPPATASTNTSAMSTCFICRDEENPETLIVACHCRTLPAHSSCLIQSITQNQDYNCRACRYRYHVHDEQIPFRKVSNFITFLFICC